MRVIDRSLKQTKISSLFCPSCILTRTKNAISQINSIVTISLFQVIQLSGNMFGKGKRCRYSCHAIPLSPTRDVIYHSEAKHSLRIILSLSVRNNNNCRAQMRSPRYIDALNYVIVQHVAISVRLISSLGYAP